MRVILDVLFPRRRHRAMVERIARYTR